MNSPLEQKSLSSEAVQRARKLLGLGECATLSEIKNAFRDMAKKYHPDKCSLRSPTTSSYGRGDKKDCEEMILS
jgi:preprotein translocase subunit Sec63